MADIKQFTDIPTTGIPSPVSQQVAADTSEATRINADTNLATSVVDLAGKAYNAYDVGMDAKVGRDLVGKEPQLDEGYDPNLALTAEEDAELNFRQLSRARGVGLSSDRAKVAAASRLQKAIANNPSRADALRKAYKDYFGNEGAGTFDKSALEKANEQMVNYGLTQFGIDTRLAQVDPAEWEVRFATASAARSKQQAADAAVKEAEQGRKLTALEQEQTFPNFVASAITNKDSENYLPTLTQGILANHMPDGGTIDPKASVNAVRELETFRNNILAKTKETYSALPTAQFDSIIKPINAHFDKAIRTAKGELTLELFQQEVELNNTVSMSTAWRSNPDAAAELHVLSEITRNFPAVPPYIVKRQADLVDSIMGSWGKISDPTSSVTGSDLLDPSQQEAYSTLLENAVGEAGKITPDSPATEKERLVSSVSVLSKELLANPEEFTPTNYQTLFRSLTNPEVLSTLSPDQRAVVEETLTNEPAQKYLTDTIQHYSKLAREGVSITYDPKQNILYATVDSSAPNRVMATKSAREINRMMSASNQYFTALENVMGTDGTDVLASTDVGTALLAASGIEVGEVEVDLPIREQVSGLNGPNRARFEMLTTRIVKGNYDTDDVEEFNMYVDKYPKVKDLQNKEVQEAMSKVSTPEIEVPADVVEGDSAAMDKILKDAVYLSSKGLSLEEINKKIEPIGFYFDGTTLQPVMGG